MTTRDPLPDQSDTAVGMSGSLGILPGGYFARLLADASNPPRYACGVDASMEVTCEHCPDPDGCIDAAASDQFHSKTED